MVNNTALKGSWIMTAGLCFCLAAAAQQSQLKLVFTGDIMGHDTQIASALATGEPGYDYKPCFQYLRPYLQEADLVIGNLEVTFAGTPHKGYPAFSSPDQLAGALKWAGFDILVNANNHALDRGRNGLVRTIEVLDQEQIIQTGTFPDPDSRSTYYPLIIEKNGIRIALLNYTYGTNGIKDRPPAIVNRIDRAQIREDLQKAKTAQPDFILVTMHWGNEYQLTESQQQKELAAFLFKHGADAVIGSHPHVVQPIRGEGAGDLVVYSMGNLVSNQRNRYRNGGILFEMVLSKEPHEIASYAYLPVWVWKPVTKKGTRFTLVPANLDPASATLSDMSAEDWSKMTQFLEDTRSRLEGHGEVITP
ncbi:MAG: CapA family protein [Bacteroidales bacterium]|nr:CapA family protein [Bacteroidales bacterium]